MYTPPGAILRTLYRLAGAFERCHSSALRQKVLAELLEHMRFELHTTAYTSISPVSGLLNLLCLWFHDPSDADFRQGLQGLEGWMWEDEQQGLRLAGARSATWDTSFAVQSLEAASPHMGESAAGLHKARAFLAEQQIR